MNLNVKCCIELTTRNAKYLGTQWTGKGKNRFLLFECPKCRTTRTFRKKAVLNENKQRINVKNN